MSEEARTLETVFREVGAKKVGAKEVGEKGSHGG